MLPLAAVAADAAVYFKATDREDLIHRLETTLMDTELKKQLVARGTERLKRFQLRDCIDQTLAVYRSLA